MHKTLDRFRDLYHSFLQLNLYWIYSWIFRLYLILYSSDLYYWRSFWTLLIVFKVSVQIIAGIVIPQFLLRMRVTQNIFSAFGVNKGIYDKQASTLLDCKIVSKKMALFCSFFRTLSMNLVLCKFLSRGIFVSLLDRKQDR